MKIKSVIVVGFLVLIMLSYCSWLAPDNVGVRAQGENREPILSEPAVYLYEEEGEIVAEFGVFYQDLDGDEGTVLLFMDSNEPETMRTVDNDPIVGQYYLFTIPEGQIDDNTVFRFFADDNNGSFTHFPPEDADPFLVGDFLGWGEPPILSNPDVYFDGDDWVFNVTYQDPDGDEAEWVELIINDEIYMSMETSDPDPFLGQNFEVRVLEGEIYESTRFYFDTQDLGGSYTDLYDENWEMFEVRDFLGSNGPTNGDGEGDGGNGGIGLPKGWFDNPEVVVGIIGLIAIGAGSAYGVWRKKKKHGRFSELLTKLDDIYSSYKLNPKRCETELEKLRATINEDLKKNTIDENNYSILKGRIDDIILEIREESLHSQVTDLPKDIELKIKDMLIDGEITRAEYDKLLPIIKGSDMASTDKEKMKKMVESWVKEDKE